MAGYGTAAEIHLKGFTELNRVLLRADKDLRREFRDALRDAAAPVRERAEQLAGSQISHLHGGSPWSLMRVGVTTSSVYVAPKQRGTTIGPLKRPNFGPLLLDDAMVPALEQEQGRVVARIENLLDDFSHMWEFKG